MSLWEALRMAAAALRAHRLRSALTMLGTVVGVLAVVSVVAITQGLNRYVSQELLATGSHIFSLSQFGIITGREEFFEALKRKPLRLGDAEYLAENLTTAEAVVPAVGTQSDVEWRGRRAKGVFVRGMGTGYEALGDMMSLASGRHLSLADVRGARRTAVIGWDLAEQLFAGVDPVGQRVRVERESFMVVGVIERQGKVLGISRDNLLVVPVTAFQKIHGRRQSIEILVRAAGPDLYAACQDEAQMLLKLRRGLNPWDDPDFGMETSEAYYALYDKLTGVFFLGMIAVVGLSVVVGGIVMMNIMLVAVSERTREIGIAKAIGARRRDILLQFLVEAAALSGSGGVIGVVLGAGVAWLVQAVSPLPTRVAGWSVAGSLTLAFAVGMLSGMYPAHRAARLSPVHALRHER
jgi:putative ABC transport system permease protein